MSPAVKSEPTAEYGVWVDHARRDSVILTLFCCTAQPGRQVFVIVAPYRLFFLWSLECGIELLFEGARMAPREHAAPG